MEKPWIVCATFPTMHSKEFGSYSSRACAEQDARKYRRLLGSQITVRVVWSGNHEQ
jgi:hypothetical protein